MVAEEDGIVEPVVDRVVDNAPLLAMDLVLAVLLDADDAEVAVARARSDACHLSGKFHAKISVSCTPNWSANLR